MQSTLWQRVVGVVFLVALLAGVSLIWIRSELDSYRQAFLYAFSPYEFTRSVAEMSLQLEATDGLFTSTAIRAANPAWSGELFVNRHVHGTELADHRSRSVTTPNNDTLYTSAVLDLGVSPVEVILPGVGERYLSVALMDVFTDQFAHLGPRETGGQGGRYWILGPGDDTPVPEGVTALRAPGDDVWLLARTFVAGTADLDAARRAQQGIVVQAVNPEATPRPFAVLPTDIRDADNFLKVVNAALARNAAHPQTTRAAQFAALGIGGTEQPGKLGSWLWSLVTARAKDAIAEQVNARLAGQVGWSVPPANIGFYGDDDATRAGIALIGFGALRQEDAIYYRMTRTADGESLDGQQRYRMLIPAGVPAQAFWSLALYEPDDTGRYYFYANPLGRHSLNSAADGLKVGADGSVEIITGSTPPTDPDANWMPTPEGPFAAFFRLYLPAEEVIRDGWMPPALSRW